MIDTVIPYNVKINRKLSIETDKLFIVLANKIVSTGVFFSIIKTKQFYTRKGNGIDIDYIRRMYM